MKFTTKPKLYASVLIFLILILYTPLIIYTIITQGINIISSNLIFNILYAVMYIIAVYSIIHLIVSSYCSILITNDKVTITTLKFFKREVVSFEPIDILKIDVKVNSTRTLDFNRLSTVTYKVRKDKDYVIKLNNFFVFNKDINKQIREQLKVVKSK